MNLVGIIGSGSWAMALSKIIKTDNLIIKVRDRRKAENNFKSKKKLVLTNKFEKLSTCNFIFLAIPSQAIRENLKLLKKEKDYLGKIFIICSKGVERKTNKLMSQVFEEFLNNEYAILSGPNFSSEVIKGLPTASVLSSKTPKTSMKISKLFEKSKFRTYFNNDIIGTQIGGAMKNVIAIACGLIQGRKLGNNAQASIITRGLSEMVSLGLKMGAKRTTFLGLSGIGDLSLTCSSLKSRNTTLGFEIGKELFVSKKKSSVLTEGFYSCDSICNLGRKFKVELPICNAVKKALDGKNIEIIIEELLKRPLQFEK